MVIKINFDFEFLLFKDIVDVVFSSLLRGLVMHPYKIVIIQYFKENNYLFRFVFCLFEAYC